MGIKTHTCEPFILSNNSDINIIIFSCKTNINFLCKSETIYLDGTFDYCPKLFTQIFTLHGYFNNNYVPLVFALLPNKTKQTYTHFLNILVLECQNIGLILKPITVIFDFDESIHIALKEVRTNVNIFECRFHLTQSLYRKIQNLGLCIKIIKPPKVNG
jgi:hypothetical protein